MNYFVGKVVYPKRLAMLELGYLRSKLSGHKLRTPYKVVWIPRNLRKGIHQSMHESPSMTL